MERPAKHAVCVCTLLGIEFVVFLPTHFRGYQSTGEESAGQRKSGTVREFVKPRLSFYLLLLSSPHLILRFQQTFTGFVEAWDSYV